MVLVWRRQAATPEVACVLSQTAERLMLEVMSKHLGWLLACRHTSSL